MTEPFELRAGGFAALKPGGSRLREVGDAADKVFLTAMEMIVPDDPERVFKQLMANDYNQTLARTFVPLEDECNTHPTSKRQLLTNVNTEKGGDSSRNSESPHQRVDDSQWEVAQDQASKQGCWEEEQRTHQTAPKIQLLDLGCAHVVPTTDDSVKPQKETLQAATETTETNSTTQETCHVPFLWTLAQKANVTPITPSSPRPYAASTDSATDKPADTAEYEMTGGTVRVKEEDMGDADLCPTSIPACLVPAQEEGLVAGESDGHHTPPSEHGLATEIRAQMGSVGRVTIESGHTERPTPALETGGARLDHCVPLIQSHRPMMMNSKDLSGGRAFAYPFQAWETKKGEAFAPLAMGVASAPLHKGVALAPLRSYL